VCRRRPSATGARCRRFACGCIRARALKTTRPARNSVARSRSRSICRYPRISCNAPSAPAGTQPCCPFGRPGSETSSQVWPDGSWADASTMYTSACASDVRKCSCPTVRAWADGSARAAAGDAG
jgi:hypothetical protein